MASRAVMATEQQRIEFMRDVTLMNDRYMMHFFSHQPELVEFILHIILGDMALRVISVETQKVLSNPFGRSVRLDILAQDEAGVMYDIEIQNAKKGAHPKRLRYYQSMLDVHTLQEGGDYDELRNVMILCVTESDYFNKNFPVYFVERTIRFDGSHVDDGTCFVYINGKWKGDDPIGRLIHDFHCRLPEEMYYENLAHRAAQFKQSEEKKQMTSVFEEICQTEWEAGLKEGHEAGLKEGHESGLKEGHESGLKEGRLGVLFTLVRDGDISVAKASQKAGISEEEFLNMMASDM